LDYLSAFGNSIMAEVSRIEASALSLAKSDFISSISHELRSPLHGILAGTELLRDSMTQSSESAMLNNIDACGNMLLDTMNHLLDYAKYVIDQFFVRDTG
jgi:signal transduction histidine kinase